MVAIYKNMFIQAELGESRKGKNFLEDADTIVRGLKENGISEKEATEYVNEQFLDLLSDFISGGLVSRTVREIGSTPEYYKSPEHAKSKQVETTFTLTKKLSVDLGGIYPYIDVSIGAGLVEMKKTRFPFKLTGKVTVQNPRITVFKGKIVRAAIGTVTPSFSLFYSGGGKDRLIHTFDKPFTFNEINFTYTPDRYTGPGPAVAPA
jgi:hypothetical protein